MISAIRATPWVDPRPRSRAQAWAAARAVPLAVLALMLAVWCVEHVFVGQVRGGRTVGYLAFGALPNATVAGRGSPGQWWRYVSDALVNEARPTPVVLVNAAFLLIYGSHVERIYGRRTCLAALATASVIGGLIWMGWTALGFVAVPDDTLGASAAGCGLLGLLLAYSMRRRPLVDPEAIHRVKAQAALGIAGIVLLGLVVPGLNNAAHAGGLAGGLLLGLIVPARPEWDGSRPSRRVDAALWAIVAAAGLSLVFDAANLTTRLLGH
jgi:membrane associated rhomboid family serine protease